MARAQLVHILLDVNFLHKPKVVSLRSRYGHVTALALIEIYSMMSRATNAQIDCHAAYYVIESLGIQNPKEIVDYCIKNEMLTLENEMLSNARVVKDQEKLGKYRERKAKNQSDYRETKEVSVTGHRPVTPDTDTDTVTECINLDPKEEKPSKPSKTKFLEFVYLSEAELEKFKDELGEPVLTRCIEKLDAWIASDPTIKRKKNGQNAAACFRSWVINSIAEEQGRARAGPQNQIIPRKLQEHRAKQDLIINS